MLYLSLNLSTHILYLLALVLTILRGFTPTRYGFCVYINFPLWSTNPNSKGRRQHYVTWKLISTHILSIYSFPLNRVLGMFRYGCLCGSSSVITIYFRPWQRCPFFVYSSIFQYIIMFYPPYSHLFTCIITVHLSDFTVNNPPPLVPYPYFILILDCVITSITALLTMNECWY